MPQSSDIKFRKTISYKVNWAIADPCTVEVHFKEKGRVSSQKYDTDFLINWGQKTFNV